MKFSETRLYYLPNIKERILHQILIFTFFQLQNASDLTVIVHTQVEIVEKSLKKRKKKMDIKRVK